MNYRLPDSHSSAEQESVTRRYNRVAWLYDLCAAPMELMGTRRRRERLLANAAGQVLEAGIGTGQNLPHYPRNLQITGIDVSERMLARAERRAEASGHRVTLELRDVSSLPYEDKVFDTAVATCVFCSVADPVAGLRELGRVTSGRILLLEHVRPRNRVAGWIADSATILTRRVFGFRLNRRTEANLIEAGLTVIEVRSSGIWREIVAAPPASTGRGESPAAGEPRPSRAKEGT